MKNEKEVNQENEVIAGGEGSGSAFTVLDESTSDKDTSIDSEDHTLPDYTLLSKKELVEAVKELVKTDDYKKSDTVLKEIKPLIDDIRAHEKSAALLKFKEAGGIEDDFEYRLDELDHAYEATLKLLRDRR